MKKVLLSMVAFASMAPIMGQELQIDPISRSLTQELRALPAKDQTFEQKLSSFKKAVEYLKGARDCLRGIGCTKRQAYLANYLLGAAYGFTHMAAVLAIAEKDPEFAVGVSILAGMVGQLGYAHLVEGKTELFRCLIFRGCTDQTKRYAFYHLGLFSGYIGATLRKTGFDMEKINRQAATFNF